MAKKITTSSGNVKTTLSGNGFEFFDRFLDLVVPETKKIIEREFEEIFKNAQENWLVRGAKEETKEQKVERTYNAMVKIRGYSPEQARAIIKNLEDSGRFQNDDTFQKSEQSQDSKGKLKLEFRVNQKYEIVASIRNDAPYAWAIRVGANSDTNLPFGKRIADELIWKPVRKASAKISKAMAAEIAKK
tara:strand:- start:43 stop:606 length:564 start_codon:yes stop_codon:yes gene_type:complete